MAGRKKREPAPEALLLCPSSKPGNPFPDLPLSAIAGIDEAGRGCLAGPVRAGFLRRGDSPSRFPHAGAE